MAREWQLQDTEDTLSDVVDAALADGPQVITRRGQHTAIVLSFDDYRQLLGGQQKLSDFFRTSPFADIELDLIRDISVLRNDVDL